MSISKLIRRRLNLSELNNQNCVLKHKTQERTRPATGNEGMETVIRSLDSLMIRRISVDDYSNHDDDYTRPSLYSLE